MVELNMFQFICKNYKYKRNVFFDYNCKSDFNFIVNNFAFQKKFFVMLIIFFGLMFKNIKYFQKNLLF